MGRPKSLPPFQKMDVSTMDKETVTDRIVELQSRFREIERLIETLEIKKRLIGPMMAELKLAYARAAALL